MARTPASSSRSATTSSDRRPRWRRWAWWLAIPAIFLALALGAFLFVVMVQVPLPEDIAPGATTVLDRNGEVVGTLTGETTRRDVAFEELPETTRLAVLAAEDRDFYTHGGVSPLGILRAAVTNLRAGEVEQGGSTITQQYVKNAVVGTERSYTRKMREAALAIKLDREYPKDTVLGWYLNTIYWGRGAYGIGAASQTYFGTPASQMSLNQAATLAGMISSPENLDPAENPDGAEARRVYVLDGMLEEGWITQAEHDQAVAEGLPEVTDNTALSTATAPYYLDAVRRELRGIEQFGDRAVAGDLKVYTGLAPRMQRAAEQEVRDTLAANELGDPELSGAMVSVDPRTGEIRALVGGPDFQEQQFNIADRGYRQVGSTFKAFTLGGWLEAGLSPESRLPGPATIQIGEDEFSNYGDQGFGEITVYEATASSVNTVFVQMQQQVGAEPIIDLAHRVGLPETAPNPDGEGTIDVPQGFPSMTLGPDGFTPKQMAGAYATFANEGIQVDPHTIVRVEDAQGNGLYEADDAGEAVMEANDARAVTAGLQGVVQSGTGGAAAIGRPMAGKTGTTQEGRDGWFVGYTPQLATAAWVGRPDNQPVEGLTGGGVPAGMWGRYMTVAMEGIEVADFTPPDLSAYEIENPAPEPCPEGYTEASAVQEQQEASPAPPDGGPQGSGEPAPATTRTEVAPGTEDREGGPCIRLVVEQPSPSPTDTETETESPSPTETETGPDLPLPTDGETTTTDEPSPSETPSPTSSPTGDGSTEDGGDATRDTSNQPASSPSPTETSTTSEAA